MSQCNPAEPLPALSPACRITIVGCEGRMGRMLMEKGAAAGMEMTGIDQPLTDEKLRDACSGADMAILCVPARHFEEVTAAVCRHLKKGAVLMDITSVKEMPLRVMEKHWPGPVIGSHPLFGPKTAEKNPVVAIIPGKNAGEASMARARYFFERLGCRTFATTAEKHDLAMAKIQNMNFITNLAYFALMANQKDLLPFLTPSFERRRAAAAKMLTEDAEMFSGLFEANEHSHEAVRQYRKMLNVAASGDIDVLCQRASWWWKDRTGKKPIKMKSAGTDAINHAHASSWSEDGQGSHIPDC